MADKNSTDKALLTETNRNIHKCARTGKMLVANPVKSKNRKLWAVM